MAGESTAAYRQIGAIFYDLWRFGSNALIAWRPTPLGIEVMTMPKARLFTMPIANPRVFSGKRLMAGQIFDQLAMELAVQPIEVRLETTIGDGPDQADPEEVEKLFDTYTVTKTRHRAVLLIDIVGFSKAEPEHQAAQLATLEFALNLAEETARGRGLKVEFARTTTGDGFYVWNREKGLLADMDFFCAIIFFLVLFSAIRRVSRTPTTIPRLRLCLGIGSHFVYHQVRRDGSEAGQFIVGDVTIQVARLIGVAEAEQILIGEFSRPFDVGDEKLDTEKFLIAVGERLKSLGALKVLGVDITRIAFYLTGPRAENGAYPPQVITVTDKHGFKHRCYNAKMNAFPAEGEAYYCGLQHADLKAAAE